MAGRAALHARRPAQRPQQLHFLHFAHLRRRYRARRGRADRGPVRDERLPQGSHATACCRCWPMSKCSTRAAACRTGATSVQDAFKNPAVKGAAPFVQTQGMLLRDGVMRPARHPRRAAAPKSPRCRMWPRRAPGQPGCAAAGPVQYRAGLRAGALAGPGIGDKVTMALAQAQVTPAGMLPRMRTFTRGRHVRGRPFRIR